MADIIGDLEQMDAGTPPPKPAEKPKAASKTPPKPEQTKKPEEVKKPETPDKPTKPEEKAEEPPPEPPKPVKAAELRTAYEGLKKKVKDELEPEVQRLRAKVKEFESKSPEDSAPLLEKIRAAEARNAELEKRIEFVDYARSKEFDTKYRQPYAQAWNDAITEFRELTIREPDGEDAEGEPKFKTRPADENDLLKLANMRLAEMDESATRMFGASAARAISHIQNIKRLSAAQNKALQDAEKRSEDWLTQRKAESQAVSKTIKDTWLNTNKSLQERFPKAFNPEAEDADDKAAFVKGFALADLIFQPGTLTDEQIESLPDSFKEVVKAKKPLTEAQTVKLHAIARLKMANHDRKVAALKKANARIAELEKALKEYEDSEPKADKAGGSAPKAGTKDWLETVEDELRAIDK